MPHAHQALLTAREETLPVLAASNRGDRFVVGLDGEERLARLRAVRAHCAIIPAREKCTAVMREGEAVASKVGHIDA